MDSADFAEASSRNSSILERLEGSKQFPHTKEKKVGWVSEMLTQVIRAPLGTPGGDLADIQGQQCQEDISAIVGQLPAPGVVRRLGGRVRVGFPQGGHGPSCCTRASQAVSAGVRIPRGAPSPPSIPSASQTTAEWGSSPAPSLPLGLLLSFYGR